MNYIHQYCCILFSDVKRPSSHASSTSSQSQCQAATPNGSYTISGILNNTGNLSGSLTGNGILSQDSGCGSLTLTPATLAALSKAHNEEDDSERLNYYNKSNTRERFSSMSSYDEGQYDDVFDREGNKHEQGHRDSIELNDIDLTFTHGKTVSFSVDSNEADSGI